MIGSTARISGNSPTAPGKWDSRHTLNPSGSGILKSAATVATSLVVQGACQLRQAVADGGGRAICVSRLHVCVTERDEAPVVPANRFQSVFVVIVVRALPHARIAPRSGEVAGRKAVLEEVQSERLVRERCARGLCVPFGGGGWRWRCFWPWPERAGDTTCKSPGH